jgi:hypothetical protein
MHKHGRAKARQHYVGFSGEGPCVEPEAETGGEQLPPHVKFGSRIGAANGSHHPRTFSRTDRVGH